MTTDKKRTSKIEIIFFKFVGCVLMLLCPVMYILPMTNIPIHRDYTEQGFYIPMLVFIFGLLIYKYYHEVAKISLDAGKTSFRITKRKIKETIEEITEDNKEDDSEAPD